MKKFIATSKSLEARMISVTRVKRRQVKMTRKNGSKNFHKKLMHKMICSIKTTADNKKAHPRCSELRGE